MSMDGRSSHEGGPENSGGAFGPQEEIRVTKTEMGTDAYGRLEGLQVYEKDKTVSVKLRNGSEVNLPRVEYRQNIVEDLGGPTERNYDEPQSHVDFDELPDEAKAAVQVALDVQTHERMRTETFPYHKRLALWPKGQGEDLLYTVAHRDGFRRNMMQYPDHPGVVTSDSSRQLDYPVEAIEKVSEGYLVTPYDGGYARSQKYRDAEVNFFAPSEEFANAFWISGGTRIIESDQPELRVPSAVEGETQARFAITPVTFYKVTENSDLDDEQEWRDSQEEWGIG